MNVAEFQKDFDTLTPAEQEELVSKLTPEELDALMAYQPAAQPEPKKSSFLGALGIFNPELATDPVQGVRSTFDTLKSAYHNIPQGAGMFAAGVDQRMREGIESMFGGNIPGARSVAEQNAFTEQAKAEFQASGMADLPGAGVFQGIGEALPFLAAPAGPSGLAGMGYSGALGALGGYLRYLSPGSDTTPLKEAGKGALGGMILRGVTEAIRAPGAALGRAEATAAGQEGAALEKATGTVLTPGQKTGNRFLASLEEGLKSTKPYIQTINKQRKAAVDYMTNVAKQFSKRPAENLTEVAGGQLGRAAEKSLSKVRRFNSAANKVAYDKYFKEAGDELIPVVNLRAKLYELAEGPVPGSPEMKAGAKAAYESLQKQIGQYANNAKQGVKGKDFLDWQQKISRELFANLDKYGKGRVQKELREALFSDAEAFSGKAAGALRGAMSTAKQGFDIEKSFLRTIRRSLFGGKGKVDFAELDPYEVGKKVATLSPPKLRALRTALAHDPEAMDTVVASWLHRNLEAAQKATNRLPGEALLTPEKFLQRLPDQDAFKALIPDAAKRKSLETGIKLFGRLSEKFGGGGGQQRGMAQTTADVMGNVVSQNPVFVARLAGKVLGPLGMSRLLLTENGQKTLRALATQNTNSAFYTNAVNDLINNYYEAAPEAAENE